jgi:anti-sigma factor ChrR (cupin superfamily)
MPDIHADFTRRVLLHTASMPWSPSPATGVERRMLDRVGGEVARATSIVRFAAGSRFPAHVHGGGEEFLVLEGVFQDEQGDWPAGSYVRNPPTSHHTPGSEPGCTLFVKLWQFDPADRTTVGLRPNDWNAMAEKESGGRRITCLHRDPMETVSMENWAPDTPVEYPGDGGYELLVLAGTLREGGDTLSAGSWLRLPTGTRTILTAGAQGCRLWTKHGHLDPVRFPDGPGN